MSSSLAIFSGRLVRRCGLRLKRIRRRKEFRSKLNGWKAILLELDDNVQQAGEISECCFCVLIGLAHTKQKGYEENEQKTKEKKPSVPH